MEGNEEARVLALMLSGVSKVYPRGETRVWALREVSLGIEKGEFIAVLGPSGAGKSTLLHLMGLLDLPSEGAVYLLGKEANTLGERERARLRNQCLGFVFQGFHLLPRLSALGNVMLPLLYRGVSRRKARGKAREALEQVGLGERASHKPGELSGGECQRVAIARAMVMKPQVVLADEPTGNLDQKTSQEILDLFEKLNQEYGATVVIVTHNPEVAARAGRRVYLRDGRLLPGEK